METASSAQAGRAGAQPIAAQANAVQANVDDPSMDTLWDVERATVDLFRTASPSVVFITTLQNNRRRVDGRVFQTQAGAGSGFLWDEDGHIVTNYHVVRGVVEASQDRRRPQQVAQVTLFDQSTHSAEIVGIAPEKDLAVVRIDTKGLDLRPLPVGESDSLQVGQSVFAIGNPFGLDYSLTTGVVSALGREIEALDRTPIRDVVQTDAAINPGNSGGPLLDSRGRLIGVNTQIYSPSGGSAGIGFAIPVDTVSWVVPDLIKHGQVIRPVLGIETDPILQRRVGLTEGILIRNVTPGSGAEKAGLKGLYQDRTGRWQIGDIILAVGGEEVRNTQELRLALENFSVGDEISVSLIRDSERIDVQVTLGKMQTAR